MGQLILIEKWAENLEEVTLNRWLKAEGDVLAAGDVLCEIITDKVTFEYEVSQPGVLRRIYCQEKSVLPVGYAIGFIGDPTEPLPEGVEERNQQLMAARETQDALDLDLVASAGQMRFNCGPGPSQRRVRATPAARRVAREAGVTVEEVAQWLQSEAPVAEADVRAYVAQRSQPST